MNASSERPVAECPARAPGRGRARGARLVMRVAGLATLVSLVALPGVLAGVVTAPTAVGVQRPLAPVALPAAAEGFSPVLAQVSCDPVAKPGVVAFRAMVLATYGHGRDGGIVRGCHIGAASHHKEGRAWDWMLDLTSFHDRRAGAHVVQWLMADEALMARRLGLNYIIWQQRIWSTFLHTEGWRPYTGPNPHLDHIHFSFSWAGAMKRTSWWTGQVAPEEYGPCRAGTDQPAPPYGSTINLTPCPVPEGAVHALQHAQPAEDWPGPREHRR